MSAVNGIDEGAWPAKCLHPQSLGDWVLSSPALRARTKKSNFLLTFLAAGFFFDGIDDRDRGYDRALGHDHGRDRSDRDRNDLHHILTWPAFSRLRTSRTFDWKRGNQHLLLKPGQRNSMSALGSCGMVKDLLFLAGELAGAGHQRLLELLSVTCMPLFRRGAETRLNHARVRRLRGITSWAASSLVPSSAKLLPAFSFRAGHSRCPEFGSTGAGQLEA